MIKVKPWNGEDLKGVWDFTFKIDGVRVIVQDGVAVSRTGKPLWNVPPDLANGDYECFLGDFKSTISRLKTHKHPDGCIDRNDFYKLYPKLDPRLLYYSHGNGNVDYIRVAMKEALKRQYEGLVLRQGSKWIKIKSTVTHDLKVIGYQEGKGKHEGRMGALMTEKGKVGTGFTDAERTQFTDDYILGKIIEVEGMELTNEGKIRHPRFIRLRLDKS